MGTCRNDSDCAAREVCQFDDLEDIQGAFGSCIVPEPSAVSLIVIGLIAVAFATFLKRRLGSSP